MIILAALMTKKPRLALEAFGFGVRAGSDRPARCRRRGRRHHALASARFTAILNDILKEKRLEGIMPHPFGRRIQNEFKLAPHSQMKSF